MEITPIYELQTRLRSAAIAGIHLLREDFRLKRAAQAMKPLENANPVFAKLCQQMDTLLSDTCANQAETLLDTIALVDAVICTLGTVEVTTKLQSATVGKLEDTHIVSSNAPYSTLKKLLEALTTTGNRHYQYVCDTHKTNPTLFEDYRVKETLVKALNAPYSELAEQAERWLCKSDLSILPLLKKNFDPKGKKEMVRRIRIIESVAGIQANSFYVDMLSTAEKEVRQELLYALRFDNKNIEHVLELFKRERGKNKLICLRVLACMNSDIGNELLRQQVQKKPLEVIEQLQYTDSEFAVEIVSQVLSESVEAILNMDLKTVSSKEQNTKIALYKGALIASIGKNSKTIHQCYRIIFENRKQIAKLLGKYTFYSRFKPVLYDEAYYAASQNSILVQFTDVACILLQSYMLQPNDDLQALILELYAREKSTNLLAAALLTQLLSANGSEQWLEDHVLKKKLFIQYFPVEHRHALTRVLTFIAWEDSCKSYIIRASYEDSLLGCKRIYTRPIDFTLRDKITEILTTHRNEEFDIILNNWCGKYTDREYCKRLGEHFYKGALTTANYRYIDYLRNSGWTDYKGIVVESLKTCNYMYTWTVIHYIQHLPCDRAEKLEEIQAISDLVRSGKLIATNLDINELEKIVKEL